MKSNKCTILHLPDGIGGILCDGSFTNEAQNYSSEKNPVATSSQKSAVSDSNYFSNDNVLGENEVFCSDCVEAVRVSYPTLNNTVHVIKTGQKPHGFSYCGIGTDILIRNDNEIIDGANLTREGVRPPKSQYICSNCENGYPEDLLERDAKL